MRRGGRAKHSFEMMPSQALFRNRKVVGLMMGCLGLSKQPTRPVPFAENSGSLQIDQIVCNSPRIRLSDGRFLAYRETGVPKNRSNYRIIVVHGFGSSKEMNFMAPQV
ncbi:unnamed protein product [Fraxinus pennsylvanica]|uniref:Uncharacterized protein n=1 Tax=Fraxinus pennsylvanica TaxID=56036 RepID=A0AAD1Z485_9LAMI|nr:unnamed protein product [Fraxinus pennsylvanica]